MVLVLLLLVYIKGGLIVVTCGLLRLHRGGCGADHDARVDFVRLRVSERLRDERVDMSDDPTLGLVVDHECSIFNE